MSVGIPFNVNHNVRVRLTDYGRKILANDPMGPYPYTEVDGWSTFQLWRLMELFGQYMFMGSPPVPFETEIMIVLEK